MNTRKTEGGTKIDIHVGFNIRLRRLAANLTLAELAEAVGTSGSRIGRHESGEVTAFPEFLSRLAVVLGCKPSDFFSGLPGQIQAEEFLTDLHELTDLGRAAIPLSKSRLRAVTSMMREIAT